MRILFCGDIVGRSGRAALETHLPNLRRDLRPDVIIVNGENAAGGFGITSKVCSNFFDLGVDCVTLGNHSWDQKDTASYISREPRLLRPLNYPQGTPGAGSVVLDTAGGHRLLVINVIGRLFMELNDDPFPLVERLLEKLPMSRAVQAIFVDFHGEATSETAIFATHFDGRVSAVIGTHTHVPTSDYRIFPAGTAFQSDAGMTGDYNSVIGMEKSVSVRRFLSKTDRPRLEAASGEATLCGCLIDTDDTTGIATCIQPLRVGGCLSQHTVTGS